MLFFFFRQIFRLKKIFLLRHWNLLILNTIVESFPLVRNAWNILMKENRRDREFV